MTQPPTFFFLMGNQQHSSLALAGMKGEFSRFHYNFSLLWSRKPESLPHIGCGNMTELRRRVSGEPNP